MDYTAGIQNQRVDQVLANPYGKKTLNDWLNPAAFALPAPGTLVNWGAPIAGPIRGGRITDTNFSSGAFGRVTNMAGSPRIVQFGVKYGF